MDERIALDALPGWAQDMIVATSPGLLMDDDAYAVPITHCPRAYTIHAHGFRYTCVWTTNPANRYVY